MIFAALLHLSKAAWATSPLLRSIIPAVTLMGGAGGVYVPYPIRVTVGGATVFVLEVSQFLKV